MCADNASNLTCWRACKHSETGGWCLNHTNQLGAQFVERRQGSKSFHACCIESCRTHRTTKNDKLVIGLSEFYRYFWSCNWINCISNYSLSSEQICNAFGLRALKSDFGKTVLRDFNGAACCTDF